MKSKKVIVRLAAATVVAGVVAGILYKTAKKHHTQKRLNQVADEGYETADDILFPGKKKKAGGLRYGPVLPV